MIEYFDTISCNINNCYKSMYIIIICRIKIIFYEYKKETIVHTQFGKRLRLIT